MSKSKYIWIILAFLLTDVFSKLLVYKYINNSISFGFLDLVVVQNQGISFGIYIPQFLIILLSFFIILILFYWFWNDQKNLFPLILILGGALGNFFERLFFGVVTDFISIGNFPSFNFADIFITIGFLILIYKEIFKKY